MTKRKAQVAVALVLVVAVAAGALLYVRRMNNKRYEAVLMDVSTDSITQTISTSGTVVSGNQGVFSPMDGVTVKTVNVKVGDKVSKGDLLATFDASSLDSVVREKQNAYDNAKATYVNSKNSASSAAAQLPEIEAQIAQLERETASLEQSVAKSEKNTETETMFWATLMMKAISASFLAAFPTRA